MFQKQIGIERYETNKEILECHMKLGQAVSPLIFKNDGSF